MTDAIYDVTRVRITTRTFKRTCEEETRPYDRVAKALTAFVASRHAKVMDQGVELAR